MHDLIIIGGGASGLSAALYAQSKQLDVRVIYQEVGGKTGRQQHLHQQDNEEYLAGAEAVMQFERRVTAQASTVLRDRVLGITRSHEDFIVETQINGKLAARSVIVATGASPIKLDVPGARQFADHGIGYSATTHAHLLENKTAAVIGATPRAVAGVIELARTAARVYLVTAGKHDLIDPLAATLARYPNVTVLRNYKVREVQGTTSVEQVVIERDEELSYLRVNAIFADLGLLPNTGVVRNLAKLDEDGFIEVDGRNHTSVSGLFAAGDCTTRFGEHSLIAVGEGVRAAQSAYTYLLSHPLILEPEPAD
ncbi:NAD(P)/FAD-dependent oxidoreductase [Chloroflexia bacterium SDU3-3]|nr:NAD(P)/FAD-dependent oxidoreductase [Chloroflexia bacterium SDU3-3]